ncbi:hypothetical protein PPYR_04089 [Photinus pyralis]|uniref:ZSWIM3 N-terminal domain-containing protein n=1 Tax=Photinus pyralis TaxID=7054 RepID=A0A1Y1LXM6_PHOPY|nr:uncharacterized protein LOC116163351 [Photinus pyralis]XP_031333100.1 uncharacterized protein LOC116163352 [Photinus pyralis]XP_031358641.1 uncharacterized protein LOC116182260 [Photinus pyralis]KAB0801903.1 hypothetical protein PPYR_04089 [Photinus pyralis]
MTMDEFRLEDTPNSIIHKQLINIPLGINLNDEFETYEEFDQLLKESAHRHYLQFWKRDCRTVEGAKKKTDRYINPNIKYYQLKYSCVQGGRVFRRKNKSLEECEANFYLTATPDGEKLFVKSLNNFHNHEVSEESYIKYFNGDRYKRVRKKEKIEPGLEYPATYSAQSESEDTNTNSDNTMITNPFLMDNNPSLVEQLDHYTNTNQFRESDGIDEFLKYISSEIRQIQSPKVIKCLKRKFIALVQEAQDEDESV